MSAAWKAKAVRLRQEGMSVTAISQALGGIPQSTIRYALFERTAKSADESDKIAREGGEYSKRMFCIDVPSWVVGTGLETDFRETAALLGRAFAVAMIGGLVRDMKAGI